MHIGYVFVMRPSPLRHPLAILRATIGLTQKEMAGLVNRAARTIQAVELGKLPLSEDLAMLIAEATGVDAGWLLANNPATPPRKGATALGMGSGTGVYGRAEFEFHRAFLQSPVASSAEMKAAYQAAVKSRAGGNHLVTLSLPVLKKALLDKKKAMLQHNDQVMLRNLKAVLDQTVTADAGDLIRWKIGEFLQSLCEEYRLSALSSENASDPNDLDVLTVALPEAKLPDLSRQKSGVAKRKRKSKVHFAFPPTEV